MSTKHLMSPWVIATWVSASFIITSLAGAQNYADLAGPWQARNEREIAVNAAGTTLYAADQVLLYKSTDGGPTWQPTNLTMRPALAVTCKWDNPSMVVIGVTNFLYSSSNGGETWNQAWYDSYLIPLRLSVSPLNSSNMYLGRQYANPQASLYYSGDGGVSWTPRGNFSFHTNVNDIAPYPLSGSGNDQTVYAAGSDGGIEGTEPQTLASTRGVWRSPDLGQTWYQSYMGAFNVTGIGVHDMGLGNFPRLAAGTASGKIFYSTNNGQNWLQPLTPPTQVTSITAVRFGNGTFYAATNNGIFASTDDGNHWSSSSTGITDMNVLSLSIAPSAQNVMFAGTAKGLFKSTNSGSTWFEIDDHLGRMPLSSVTSNGTTAWTVSENHPYASKYSINPTVWTRYQLGGGGFSGQQIKKNLYSGTGDMLFVAGAVNGVATYYRSVDGGSSYPLQYQPSANAGTVFYGTVVDAFNANYVYLFGYAKDGSGNIRNWLRSIDGGATWQSTWNPIGGSNPVRDMVVDKLGASGYSQKLLAAIQSGGVVRSTDGGGSWSQVLSASYDMRSLAMNPNNPQTIFATGYSSGNAYTWKSTDEGLTWNLAFVGYKRIVLCPGFGTNDVSHLAAISADGNKVWYSADGGINWSDATYNLPVPVNNLYADGSSKTLYVATGNGTFNVSAPTDLVTPNAPLNPSRFDVQLSWPSLPANAVAFHLQIRYDRTSDMLTDAPAITSTSFSPLNLMNDTTYDWGVASNNIAGETDFNSGQSFTTSASQTITLNCDKDANNHPVLSWSSENGSWADYKIYRYNCPYGGGAGPLRPVACSCTGAIDCFDPPPYETPFPLLATTQATSYTDLQVTIGGTNPNAVYYYQVRRAGYSNKVCVLSHRGSQTEIAMDPVIEDVKPTQTRLEPNYPNPFNPATLIRYSLASDLHVTLKVYDVLGREVAILVDQFEMAGFKSVEFDAGALPSGVYFCRLQAGPFTDVKKMLLAK